MKHARITDYTVIIHEAEEGGFWAEIPTLPGCFSQGNTFEETLKHVRQAVRSHLAGLRADHQPIPQETGVVISRVAVAFP